MRRIFGLHVAWYPAPGTLGRQLQDFLRQERINLVLDVGAYHGDYVRLLRQEGHYRGRIVSFEPTADSFQTLIKAMQGDSNWRGYHMGLSDQDGDAEFHTFGNGHFNSILPLRQDAATEFGITTRARESVVLRRLDSLWSELTEGIAEPRVFLKIDTQGHDLAVMRGAAGIRRYLIGIQSELSVIPVYETMPTIGEALTFYNQAGFSPLNFYPIASAAYQWLPTEFDVVFRQKAERDSRQVA